MQQHQHHRMYEWARSSGWNPNSSLAQAGSQSPPAGFGPTLALSNCTGASNTSATPNQCFSHQLPHHQHQPQQQQQQQQQQQVQQQQFCQAASPYSSFPMQQQQVQQQQQQYHSSIDELQQFSNPNGFVVANPQFAHPASYNMMRPTYMTWPSVPSGPIGYASASAAAVNMLQFGGVEGSQTIGQMSVMPSHLVDPSSALALQYQHQQYLNASTAQAQANASASMLHHQSMAYGALPLSPSHVAQPSSASVSPHCVQQPHLQQPAQQPAQQQQQLSTAPKRKATTQAGSSSHKRTVKPRVAPVKNKRPRVKRRVKPKAELISSNAVSRKKKAIPVGSKRSATVAVAVATNAIANNAAASSACPADAVKKFMISKLSRPTLHVAIARATQASSKRSQCSGGSPAKRPVLSTVLHPKPRPAKIGRGSPLNKTDIMTKDLHQKQALERNLHKLCTAVMMVSTAAPTEAAGRGNAQTEPVSVGTGAAVAI